MIDILKCGWKFPTDEIYIMGTGPNGLAHHNRIPWDAWVIGVNKAIQLTTKPNKPQSHDIHERMKQAEASGPDRSLPMAIWLCADTTLPQQQWFLDHVQTTIDCGFELDNRINPTPVFSSSPTSDKALTKIYPDVPYYFCLLYTSPSPRDRS